MHTTRFDPVYRPPTPLNKWTDTCKNITFPQISFLACINAMCEMFSRW